MLSMIRLPQPIVAAVHGVVTGGSLGLVLASDVVLVSPGASFTPYYAVVGFSPDGGWTAMLPQVIGQRRTAEVLLRNLTISADEAVAWGLANRLVEPELLEAEAHGVARSIADMQPGAVETGKRLLWQDGLAIGQRLEIERQRFVAQIGTAATQASMAEFLRQLSISSDK
jgi:enoyl-CoA hydratase/carnithine racemase